MTDEEDLTLEYHQKAEEPPAGFWLRNSGGNLINFAGGWTFTLHIGKSRTTPLVSKTSNIAGAAGSGEAPDGVPNITVTWDAGELDLATGTYRWWLYCRHDVNRDRVFEGPFIVKYSP